MNNPSSFVQHRDLPNLNDLILKSRISTFSGTTPNDNYIVGIPKNFFRNKTTSNNSGASRTLLHRITVNAGSLKTDEDFIEGIASGKTAANDADKSIQLEVDTNVIISMGLFDIDGAVGWKIDYTIMRLTSTTLRIVADIGVNALGVNSANAPDTFTTSFYKEVRNNDITLVGGGTLLVNNFNIDVYGQATNNADVFQNISIANITRVA